MCLLPDRNVQTLGRISRLIDGSINRFRISEDLVVFIFAGRRRDAEQPDGRLELRTPYYGRKDRCQHEVGGVVEIVKSVRPPLI